MFGGDTFPFLNLRLGYHARSADRYLQHRACAGAPVLSVEMGPRGLQPGGGAGAQVVLEGSPFVFATRSRLEAKRASKGDTLLLLSWRILS